MENLLNENLTKINNYINNFDKENYIYISLFILILCIYTYLKKKYTFASLLLIISFIFYNNYYNNLENNNDLILFEIIFLIVSYTLIFLNSYHKNIDITTNLFLFLFAVFVLVSYSIKNIDVKTSNKNISFIDDIKSKIVNYLYPENMSDAMKYHYEIIWKPFDFNLLILIVILLFFYS